MARYSRYQDLIYEALRSAAGPLSATDVHALLGETGIGLATVYRLLKKGLEGGDLVSVQLPGGPNRFEPADKPHHHHFECVACHTVFDVMGCPGGIDRLVPEGFTLEQHEIILSGRCSDCVSAASGLE